MKPDSKPKNILLTKPYIPFLFQVQAKTRRFADFAESKHHIISLDFLCSGI